MDSAMRTNSEKLKENPYPGRGILIGLTPDQKNMVQVYWIMGRSANSQNRIFIEENGFVRTEAYDPAKLLDPSLIIYSPIKFTDQYHIISNGDQTETILKALMNGKTFEDALNEREFEPDPPNFTPRISGLINVESKSYKLSILKSFYNNPEYCIRNYYTYNSFVPGVAHCITTYETDGYPIPSFQGEPLILPMYNLIDETLDYYWSLLNSKTKVAILAKYIDVETKETVIKCINKYSYASNQ
ncbi:IMP cyclohydrolase [Paenibacillus thailandensis]|uniref:IMP cyclohydrolase n=1 Tax=Paenibacillus thailandensis TaxID=393250 RepID=A0ABW5QZH3_9BACL